jgi:hypothetical protein
VGLFHEFVPECQGNCLSAIGHTQLREDMADMRFSSGPADIQTFSDFRVAQPLYDESQDLALARRQVMARLRPLGCGLN